MSSKYFIEIPFSNNKNSGFAESEDVFLEQLKRIANVSPVAVIRCHLTRNTKLPETEEGETLYLLATGIYNNRHYACHATSMNKYIRNNYQIISFNLPVETEL
jgi:hypothetical protein